MMSPYTALIIDWRTTPVTLDASLIEPKIPISKYLELNKATGVGDLSNLRGMISIV